MKQMFRFGIILGVICLVATLILAFTYEVTKPKIEAEANKEVEEALKDILPDANSFKSNKVDGIEYFDAYKDGVLIGYCIKVSGSGYGGPLHMVVGIDLNASIKGIRILDNQETPGLGTKIVEILHDEEEPYFLRQFKGKKATSLKIGANIDAITGATISSRAVTEAVRNTVDEFLRKVGK